MRLLILFAFAVSFGSLRAADIVVFDPASATVANRVVSYLKSQDTTAWVGNPNALINPTMPAGVAVRDLKVAAGVVVEMSAGEKNSITAAEASALIASMKDAGKTVFDNGNHDGRLARAIAETLIDELNILRGQIIGVVTTTFDPPSMNNATGTTSANIAVTGAAFGDFVDVAAPYSLAGVQATGYVVSAGQVVIRLDNGSGGAINLASGTWNVCVRRHTALPARTPAQARTSIRNKIDAQP